MPVLHTLSQLNIAHDIVQVLRAGLFIAFIVQMILSFVVRDQDNRFMRFVSNITGPLVNPLGSVLLLQALPPGW